MNNTTKSIVRENDKYIAAIHVLGALFFKDKETGKQSNLFMGNDYKEVEKANTDKFNFMAQKAIDESL